MVPFGDNLFDLAIGNAKANVEVIWLARMRMFLESIVLPIRSASTKVGSTRETIRKIAPILVFMWGKKNITKLSIVTLL